VKKKKKTRSVYIFCLPAAVRSFTPVRRLRRLRSIEGFSLHFPSFASMFVIGLVSFLVWGGSGRAGMICGEGKLGGIGLYEIFHFGGLGWVG